MVDRKTKATTVDGNVNSSNEVNEFMARLEHPLKAEIEAVRALILDTDKRINESIKWNGPSFYINEHFATLKLRPMESIQVIFHTGAKVKANITAMEISDPSGLLKWVAKDRCVATFSDLNDIKSKQTALIAIVKQWIEQM
jgi:hypothetical protein